MGACGHTLEYPSPAHPFESLPLARHASVGANGEEDWACSHRSCARYAEPQSLLRFSLEKLGFALFVHMYVDVLLVLLRGSSLDKGVGGLFWREIGHQNGRPFPMETRRCVTASATFTTTRRGMSAGIPNVRNTCATYSGTGVSPGHLTVPGTRNDNRWRRLRCPFYTAIVCCSFAAFAPGVRSDTRVPLQGDDHRQIMAKLLPGSANPRAHPGHPPRPTDTPTHPHGGAGTETRHEKRLCSTGGIVPAWVTRKHCQELLLGAFAHCTPTVPVVGVSEPEPGLRTTNNATSPHARAKSTLLGLGQVVSG